MATAGWDREIRLTGEAAKAMKKAICETFIYPPVNDVDALMAEAGCWPHPAVLAVVAVVASAGAVATPPGQPDGSSLRVPFGAHGDADRRG